MSPLVREAQPKTRMRKTFHTHGVIFPGRGAKREVEEKLAGSGFHSCPCRFLGGSCRKITISGQL